MRDQDLTPWRTHDWKVRTIESIVEKQGRSGRFVLVTWHTVYRNQRRDLVAEASTSMIARP